MGSLEAYMRGELLRMLEKKQRILQSAIEEKLCQKGRILSGEHIATIEFDYGSEQYFMPKQTKQEVEG